MTALGRAVAGSLPSDHSGPVADIPPEYLAAYRSAAARFGLEPDGWSYLAGIGKVESDHGRSTAPGVHAGQNAHGCCAGPMQIDNGAGTGGGTWGAFKVDGDGDGRFDIYDADDTVATAARYLAGSGARCHSAGGDPPRPRDPDAVVSGLAAVGDAAHVRGGDTRRVRARAH
jgi:hypothetical protein